MFCLDLDFFRFRFIMYLVAALLKVALVNFTLNEYMTWWWALYGKPFWKLRSVACRMGSHSVTYHSTQM